MFNDILVIADSLVEPPSEVLPFRTVTMIAREYFGMDVLLHTSQDMKDIYYHWMKPRGMMDYVSYLITEMEYEDGVRIDVVGYYPHSITVKSIRIENQLPLIGQIKTIAGK